MQKLWMIAVLVIACVFMMTVSGKNFASSTSIVDVGAGNATTTESESTTEEFSSGLFPESNGSEFGEDLVPKVDAESFFNRLYHKMFDSVTVVQRIVAYIIAAFFAIATLMVVVSCFGNQAKVPWYLLAMLICAIAVVCDLYAIPILSAFKNWFVS